MVRTGLEDFQELQCRITSVLDVMSFIKHSKKRRAGRMTSDTLP